MFWVLEYLQRLGHRFYTRTQKIIANKTIE